MWLLYGFNYYGWVSESIDSPYTNVTPIGLFETEDDAFYYMQHHDMTQFGDLEDFNIEFVPKKEVK